MKETWYDNGSEKQVDKWEERPDGSKAGTDTQTLDPKP